MIHYYKTHLRLFAKLKATSCIKFCKIALKFASDGTKYIIIMIKHILLHTSLNLYLAKYKQAKEFYPWNLPPLNASEIAVSGRNFEDFVLCYTA